MSFTRGAPIACCLNFMGACANTMPDASRKIVIVERIVLAFMSASVWKSGLNCLLDQVRPLRFNTSNKKSVLSPVERLAT